MESKGDVEGMALREAGLATKKNILSVSVRLFLQHGYRNTTIKQIMDQSTGNSISGFVNAFGSKEGILLELVKAMFSGQFDAAENALGEKYEPIYLYAVETSIQLTLTELNENLRELYTQAYSLPSTSDYIFMNTTEKTQKIFKQYLPELDSLDFYYLEIASAGIMRNFMAKKCDVIFSLDKKLERFLSSAFNVYDIDKEKQKEVIEFVHSLDIKSIAEKVMHQLFEMLEMKFDFKLDEDITKSE